MSKIGAHGWRRFARRSGMFASVFAGRSAHAGFEQVSNAVRAAFGWRAVTPSVCSTHVLKNFSKLELSSVGSPSRYALVGRLMGLPERKFAIQLYSQPPSSMFAARPAPPKKVLPLPNGNW